MLEHPWRIVTILCFKLEALLEVAALVVTQPSQRATYQTQRLASSSRRFENADFALFETLIDRTHKLFLYGIWLERVVEVSVCIFVHGCGLLLQNRDKSKTRQKPRTTRASTCGPTFAILASTWTLLSPPTRFKHIVEMDCSCADLEPDIESCQPWPHCQE